MDKCNCSLSSKKFLFATKGDHYRKLKLFKIQRQVSATFSAPNDTATKKIHAPKSQGTLQKKGQNEYKSQMARKPAMQLSHGW